MDRGDGPAHLHPRVAARSTVPKLTASCARRPFPLSSCRIHHRYLENCLHSQGCESRQTGGQSLHRRHSSHPCMSQYAVYSHDLIHVTGLGLRLAPYAA